MHLFVKFFLQTGFLFTLKKICMCTRESRSSEVRTSMCSCLGFSVSCLLARLFLLFWCLWSTLVAQRDGGFTHAPHRSEKMKWQPWWRWNLDFICYYFSRFFYLLNEVAWGTVVYKLKIEGQRGNVATWQRGWFSPLSTEAVPSDWIAFQHTAGTETTDSCCG